MKKYICILLSLCLLLLALPVAALDVDSIDENFDSLADGALPSGWTADITADSGNSIGAATMEGEDGKVLKIDARTPQTKVMLTSPNFVPSEYTVSYRTKFEAAADSYMGLYLGDANSIAFHATSGQFRCRRDANRGGDVTVGPVKADGSWNEVQIYVNNDTHQVEIWVNGICTETGKGNLFRKDNSGPANKLMLGVDKTSACVMYLDDIKMEAGYQIKQEARIDFNQAETEKPETFYPSAPGSISFNNASNLSHFDIVDGVFGKPAGDRSLYLHNDAGTLEGNHDPFVAVDLTKTPGGNRVEAGEIAVLEAKVAFSKSMTIIQFVPFAYTESTPGSIDGKLDAIQLYGEGRLRICGDEHPLPEALKPETWYTIRLEVTAGDASTEQKNNYSLYFGEGLDAQPELVGNGELNLHSRGADFNQFRGFYKLWIDHFFGNNSNKNPDGTYKEGGFYCDDVLYTREKPVIVLPEPPEITVDGLTDGMILENVTQLTAQISAADDDGVAFMEIYHNDTLLDAVRDTYTLALEDLAVGEHTIRIVSEDLDGNRAEETLHFSVIQFIESVLYTEDFTGYSSTGGNSELPSGVAGYSQRGYVKSIEVDAEHGTSMAVGIDVADTSYGTGDRPYASVAAKDTTGSVRIQFDFYIDKAATGSSPMNINFKKVGSTEQEAIRIADGRMRTGNVEVDVAEKTWYTCVLKVDIAQKRFGVDFGPAGGKLETILPSWPTSDGLDVLSHIRIWGPAQDVVKTFMAIDNIIVSKRADLPTITEIGNDGETNEFVVAHTARTLEIYLSEALRASSVGMGSVTVEENGRPVNLTDVQYDAAAGAIVAVVGQTLKSNQTYKVTISEDVILDGVGQAVGQPISGTFTTTHADVQPLEVVLTESGSGLSVQYSIENNTQEAKDVDVIVTVWDGDTFVRGMRETVTVEAQSTAGDTLSGGALSAGETAEVYVWDCAGAWPKMLANQVYTYQK